MSKKIFPRLAALALAGAACLSLCACQRKPQKAETTIFAMDTVMTLTLYGADQPSAQSALDGAVSEVYALERTLSATDEGSEIYALNHSAGRRPLSRPRLPACWPTPWS